MGVVLQKLFGGGGPAVEVDTRGACSSECCEEVEVISSSSSEPHTHPSAHAATDSRETLTPPLLRRELTTERYQ